MSTKPNMTLVQYIEESCKAWCEDQPDAEVGPDEVFRDMAMSVIDGGVWEDEGYTPTEVKNFCRAYGFTFPGRLR